MVHQDFRMLQRVDTAKFDFAKAILHVVYYFSIFSLNVAFATTNDGYTKN